MATAKTDESSLPDPTATVSFDDTDDRADAMQDSIEQWVADLAEMTNEARASEEFQEWLEVHSQFHDYSPRNTLLIKMQMPDATKVAGFWTWQNKFDRHVKKGESAIWIWAPIISEQCPECGNAPSYHERDHVDCDHHVRSDPDGWSEGVVGFKPTSVFDVSQTEGESLPELATDAHGQADGLVDALLDAADRLEYDVSIVPDEEWTRSSEGYCKQSSMTMRPVIKVRDRDNKAALARVLIHEYAHAELHGGRDDTTEAKEVEADAVAYIVCRYFGLDASNAANYLAAWAEDAPETLHERLDRISDAADHLIATIPQEAAM